MSWLDNKELGVAMGLWEIWTWFEVVGIFILISAIKSALVVLSRAVFDIDQPTYTRLIMIQCHISSLLF